MLLRLEKVARSYGDRLIFKDVDFALAPGEAVLLLGRNGAGKSTLMQIMAGLLPPSAGSVTVKDGARLGRIGHQGCIYPRLSALENLLFWSALNNRPTSDSQALKALEEVELAAFADEPAASFSRGMAQRLDLARVFLLEPDILLLDEPATGLDTRSTAMLHAAVHAARRRGVGIVWITHSPETDSQHADRVVRLEKKRLLAGPPESPQDGTPSIPQGGASTVSLSANPIASGQNDSPASAAEGAS